MKYFLKLYAVVFIVLAILTYVVYSLSLKIIFGESIIETEENVLGSQTEVSKKPQTNMIVINPDRSKEKNESRLELSNGIVDDYIFLFDNINHSYIEGESVPNHNIFITLGNFKTVKQSNPDGFFSIELPKDINQFQKGTIELKDENFQVIKSYSFIFIQKDFLGRSFFLNSKNNTVFSIQTPPGYKASVGSYQSLDNGMCKLEHDFDKYVADFNNPEINILVLPKPLTIGNIQSNEYAIFSTNTIGILELQKCIDELKPLDFKIEWHTKTINDLLAGSINGQTKDVKGVTTTVSDPVR